MTTSTPAPLPKMNAASNNTKSTASSATEYSVPRTLYSAHLVRLLVRLSPYPLVPLSACPLVSHSALRDLQYLTLDIGRWTLDNAWNAPHLLPRPAPPRHHDLLPPLRPGRKFSSGDGDVPSPVSCFRPAAGR